MLLRSLNNGIGDKKRITTIKQPLPQTLQEEVAKVSDFASNGFSIGGNLSFGMSFLAASFVVFLVKERMNRAKHLQFVSGVKFTIFWLGNFLFDIVNYVISCIFLIILLVAFRVEDFETADVIGHIFIVFLAYGWAVIPFMYLWSFVFDIPSTAFIRMLFFNILTGMATIIAITVLEIPSLNTLDVAKALDWVFMIFPNYCLGMGVVQVASNKRLGQLCPLVYPGGIETACEKDEDDRCCTQFGNSYLGWNPAGIGRRIFFLFLTGFISIIIILIIESKIIQKIRYGGSQKSTSPVKGNKKKDGPPNVLRRLSSKMLVKEDTDVELESMRIRDTNLTQLCKTDNLIIKDLTKLYKRFLAVDHLNLGVQKGECFGLLGVNGAGKTTTFKMLTGDLPITEGDAYVYGKSVKSDLKKVQRNIGYCPQFDAIIEELTGRETIRLFARLRGVPEKQIDRVIEDLSTSLLFAQHIDKRVGAYSGGNKRKLSTALALVGGPPIVYLDEPTTGMDPVARRQLWGAITKIQETGTSIVLTSHSMEECEALCSRLSIMVNGKFRCLGSPQHLKSKFGEGYTLIAQCSTSEGFNETKDGVAMWEIELEPLREFIETTFGGCILKDIHPGFVQYQVTDKRITWGKMFEQMEKARVRFNLEAYSVGQTSLEQVFLNFTKSQVSNEDNK